VNYGGQYLADVAPSNAASDKLSRTDSFSSPDVIAYSNAVLAFSNTLLRQQWPANARADTRALASGLAKVYGDIQDRDTAAWTADENATFADAQAVRADLGLQPVPVSSTPAPAATLAIFPGTCDVTIFTGVDPLTISCSSS
jgi:hypothetical protein